MGSHKIKSSRRKKQRNISEEFWANEFYSPPVFIGRKTLKKRNILYKEKLQDPRWKKKRDIIFKRDSYICQKCGAKTSLQVHHKKYKWGRDPWNYPNKQLVTLCSSCHKKEHLKIDAVKGKKTLDKELDSSLSSCD